jgi:hypothetical protein
MAKFKANIRLVKKIIVLKLYQFAKLRPLSVRICAILYVKYWLNIANITKKTPESKPYVVLILSLTVCWLLLSDNVKSPFSGHF